MSTIQQTDEMLQPSLKHPSQVNPSMLRLMGTKDWDTLEKLIKTGAYDDIIQDDMKMSTVITFAVNFRVPIKILNLMCHLNPDALITGDLPFRIARQQGSSAQTLIILEAARQKALLRNFQ